MSFRSIYIEAPARLHLGFLDLSGSLGRRFGSVGLTIEDVATKIIIKKSTQFSVDGPIAERCKRYVQRFCERKNLDSCVQIEVLEHIPDHVGLGSGTQLALAIGKGLAEFNHQHIEPKEIAEILDRGVRSGIGVGSFEAGGFLVDAGRGAETKVPPIVCRLNFPSSWRLVLILDTKVEGAHGVNEREIFGALQPFPEKMAARLCHLTVMKLLPAVTERNIHEFQVGISELQVAVGNYFAPHQGGRYTSADVRTVMNYVEQQGVQGVGQSSWGPTGFIVVDSETRAYKIVRDLQSRFWDLKNLQFKIVSGRNRGAVIEEKLAVEYSIVRSS